MQTVFLCLQYLSDKNELFQAERHIFSVSKIYIYWQKADSCLLVKSLIGRKEWRKELLTGEKWTLDHLFSAETRVLYVSRFCAKLVELNKYKLFYYVYSI